MSQAFARRLGLMMAMLVIALLIPVTITAESPPLIPHTLEGRSACLACHQTGVAGAPHIPADHAGRTNDMCRLCHQPAAAAEAATPTPAAPAPAPGLVPTPIAHPTSVGVNSCYDCHNQRGGRLADIAGQWSRSVHAERNVGCADCHGGDPSATTASEAMSPAAGFVGIPARAAIPALCASCHSDVTRMRQYRLATDQYAQYQESVHGLRLAAGDRNVATCDDCHGGHQVLPPNDPSSTVFPVNVPRTCANCHADQALMAPYQIPTNQLELYRDSVHGHLLLDQQDFRAPTCATCHGTHGAAPPGLKEVADVCGTCHSATQADYEKSPHANAASGPRCVTCHRNHDVQQPTDALFVDAEPQHCGACHDAASRPGQVAQSLYAALTGGAQAYDTAEGAIQLAQQAGMLVSPLEAQLRAANTNLITARAVQHTLAVAAVSAQTDNARATADKVKAAADAQVAESIFRRQAMVIAVAAIGLAILPLYLIKRELDRRLDRER